MKTEEIQKAKEDFAWKHSKTKVPVVMYTEYNNKKTMEVLADLDSLLEKIMPSEDDVREAASLRFGKPYTEFDDGLIMGFEIAGGWFRNRMKGGNK